jgi:hypothetical protein
MAARQFEFGMKIVFQGSANNASWFIVGELKPRSS